MASPVKCPKGMAFIDGRTFKMGSKRDECQPPVYNYRNPIPCPNYHKPDKRPVRDITVSGLCMDNKLVNIGEYEAFDAPNREKKFRLIATACGDNNMSIVARGDDAKKLLNDNKGKLDGNKICGLWVKSNQEYVRPKATKEDFDVGVSNVDWLEAKEYCEAHGKRLPTEAEWEMVAKSPMGYEQFNKDAPQLDPIYSEFEMPGGKLEWMGDWYQEDAYKTMASKDPTGPSSGTCKVLRGIPRFLVNDAMIKKHGPSARQCADPLRRVGYEVGFRCVTKPKS